MKDLVWHDKEDIRCDTVSDPAIEDPRDAIVKVTSCAICGSLSRVLSHAHTARESTCHGARTGIGDRWRAVRNRHRQLELRGPRSFLSSHAHRLHMRVSLFRTCCGSGIICSFVAYPSIFGPMLDHDAA